MTEDIASKKGSRTNNDLLLIIRGLAALSVVFWHGGGYLGEYPAWVTIPGRTAVWLFFGISGYVIAFGFMHDRYGINVSDLKDFYINRFLRIYPIFVVLSCLGWATEFVLTGRSPISISEIPSQFLAMQFDQNYIINGVFWTLGIELQFYILAPVITWILFSEQLNRFWFPKVLFFYAGLVFLQKITTAKYGLPADSRNLFFCLPHFIAGMIACRAVCRLKPRSIVFYVALSLGVALVGITNYMYRFFPAVYWSFQGILLVDFAIVAFIIAHASWRGGGGAISILTKLGILSYGLYAWHGYWLKTAPSLADNVLLLVIISMVAAYCTYRWIEKPALGFKRVHFARN